MSIYQSIGRGENTYMYTFVILFVQGNWISYYCYKKKNISYQLKES